MSNPFSAKLSELIYADGRTVARICREAGDAVKPVALHAYKDGRRLPQSASTLAIIAQALRLPAYKQATLVRAYTDAVQQQATTAREVARARASASSDRSILRSPS